MGNSLHRNLFDKKKYRYSRAECVILLFRTPLLVHCEYSLQKDYLQSYANHRGIAMGAGGAHNWGGWGGGVTNKTLYLGHSI